MQKPIGIYIHVPFCTTKCFYCDFYSGKPTRALVLDYTKALLEAIKTAPIPDSTQIDSIYFGGGTPVLMGEELCTVLTALKSHFDVTKNAEITVEANPGSVGQKLLQSLCDSGFNRISFGLQSACSKELALLGRTHSAKDCEKAVKMARQAGFKNISLDVMLGLPHQLPQTVEKTIQFCAEQQVQHISAYILKIEAGTAFAATYNEDDVDEDIQADIYLQTVAQLKELGYAQYEISNFAMPEHEGVHNLHYWRCEQYLGLGPAAASFYGGRRFVFPSNVQDFIKASDKWELIQQEGTGGDVEEELMLRLRLCEGVNLSYAESLQAGLAAKLQNKAAPMAKAGLVETKNGALSLTPKGMLLSNSVILQLIE